MTTEQFNIFWTSTYPNTVPISSCFKHDYSDRWLRIHSLPESKRYPENEADWKILLTRQNQLITDLLGDNSNVLLVTGEFNWGERKAFITEENEVFKSYNFSRLDTIDLYKLNPDNYDKDDIYRAAFAETVWSVNKHDSLLKEIANDNTRAFFVSVDKNVLIAPYDGGVDILLKDRETKESYKQKYNAWLSTRVDGF